MPNQYPKVLLKDNRKISPPELKTARDLCSRVSSFVENRKDYVIQRNLNPEFCLPSGNWRLDGKNELAKVYNYMVKGEEEALNRLRLYSQIFTGYSLRYLSDAKGLDSMEPPPSQLDEEIASRLDQPDRWCDLWKVAVEAVPADIIFNPPRLMGEIGWDIWKGVVVNHDTYSYQERLNLLYEAGVFEWLSRRIEQKGQVRILEIGSGYGGLALAIKKILPQASYWLCDLPECLLFSSIYLTLCAPHCSSEFVQEAPFGFTYLPNYMFEEVEEKFDLAINTISFSEISPNQIEAYAHRLCESLLEDDGFIFEQNNYPWGENYSHIELTNVDQILMKYFPHQMTIPGESLHEVTKGQPIIWSRRPINLKIQPVLQAESHRSQVRSAMLVEKYGNYNIVKLEDIFLGCLQELGPVDLGVETLGARDLPPYILTGKSVKEVKGRLKKLESSLKKGNIPRTNKNSIKNKT